MGKKDFSYKEKGEVLNKLRGVMSKQDFSASLKIPYRTYLRYETGERDVPDGLIDLARLLTGEGEMQAGQQIGLPKDFVTVPRYNVMASAGGGSLVESEQVVDHLAFRAEWVRNALGVSPKDLAVVSVIGESMEPYLADGDLILIDTKVNRFVGDAVYVLANDGVLQVKRLQLAADGSLMMKSENPRYGDMVYREDAMNGLRIIGKLVRRLVR